MTRTRRTRGIFAAFASALVAPAAAQAVLDRPPEVLGYRQVGDELRLLWAPGGDADGTLNENVVSYTVHRTGLSVSGWTTIFSGDQSAMTYVDSIADSATWTDHQGGSVQYRVEAATSSDATLSATVGLVPPLTVIEIGDRDADLDYDGDDDGICEGAITWRRHVLVAGWVAAPGYSRSPR